MATGAPFSYTRRGLSGEGRRKAAIADASSGTEEEVDATRGVVEKRVATATASWLVLEVELWYTMASMSCKLAGDCNGTLVGEKRMALRWGGGSSAQNDDRYLMAAEAPVECARMA